MSVRFGMRKWLYMAGLSLALGSVSPGLAYEVVELSPDDEPVAADNSEYQELSNRFLSTTTEMWFLLSGIASKEGADAAAPRFAELVKLTFELDNKMSAMPILPTGDAECAGMLDGMQLRILETMDDMHVEFVSLCRAHCYGSAALTKAFEDAVRMGMFSEEEVEELREPGDPLSEDEARLELVRLKRLAEPDRAVFDVLVTVQDVSTASLAAPELTRLSQRFKSLLPEARVMNRDFAPQNQASAQEVLAPIEPILWAIRSEIVRIAALPGYEAETYDAFSDALDRVFECLAAAHCNIFDSIFDASFRSDLDNALQENAVSSQ